MKKRQVIILSTIVGVILIITLMISSNKKVTEPKKEAAAATGKYVRTESAVNMVHPLIIDGHGRVGSSRNLLLIAEVQGKLLPGQVKLKSGESFKQGQLLFSIDDVEVSYKMQARKSSYMTLLASALPDLKIDYPEAFKSWETFFEKIDVTEPLPELPAIKSVKEKTYLASRNILGEYYSIKADEKSLEKFKIYAPFNGSFMEVFAQQGTVVNPGSQVARIIESSNLEINVPISVEEVQFLQIGHVVTLFLGNREQPVLGKILRIGNYVNPNTQSIDVFVGLDDKNPIAIYDGMYVEAEILGGELKDVVKVPRKALINHNHVYLVRDSFLVKQEINVASRDDEYAYIKGLNDGENVVVEALSNPVDSMIVKMISDNE